MKAAYGALGRIRTCDTRFRNSALYLGSVRPEDANRHGVFAFSRVVANRCSISDVLPMVF
jgi:hypothetical protein